MNEILRHKMLRQKKVSFSEYFRAYEPNDEAIFHLYHCEQKGGIQNIIFFIVNSGDECP